MSSLEKVSPGISPRFLSQKMKANELEKKMRQYCQTQQRRQERSKEGKNSRWQTKKASNIHDCAPFIANTYYYRLPLGLGLGRAIRGASLSLLCNRLHSRHARTSASPVPQPYSPCENPVSPSPLTVYWHKCHHLQTFAHADAV